MKIKLTESQISHVLTEISQTDELNFLLDKMLSDGIDSLTHNERIRLRQLSGEKVDMPKDPEPDEVNDEKDAIRSASLLFFENFPNNLKIPVGDRIFEGYVNDIEYGDVDLGSEFLDSSFINITDGEITIKLIPFADFTRRFIFATDTGKVGIKYNGEIPTDDESAKLIVRFFIKQLPNIIQKVVDEYNKKDIR